MKSKLTLLVLLLSFHFCNAKFIEGNILFNDGHIETGFIKSFLEEKIIDLNIFGSLEQSLNLTDENLKFKSTEEGDIKNISIDDINEVTLKYEDNYSVVYKVILLKTLNSKGEFNKKSQKVYLPYVKRGKINIYGYTYKYTRTNAGRTESGKEIVFYYQNSKENYAFNYFDIDLVDLFNLRSRLGLPLKELFKDCPELAGNEDKYFIDNKKLTKEERQKIKENGKKMQKILSKEYKNIPDETKNGNLELYHKYEFSVFDELISRYENDCK